MENVNIQNEEHGEEIQLIPLLKQCYRIFLDNWYWFVLSVVVCVGLGLFYAQRQPRVFKRQAVMLFEDSEGGYGSSRGRSGMNTLLELNGVSVGGNLKNEMFVLTSSRLMERVADSLNLDVTYTTTERLHPIALYKDAPFSVTFLEEFKSPVSFIVEVVDGNTCRLSEFAVKGLEKSKSQEVKVGEEVKTPAGLLKIEKAATFDGFPRDKEVTVTRMSNKMAGNVCKGKVTASEYDKECSLVVISCQDINPARAEDILNEVFNAYKLDVVSNKNRVALNTADFIDARLNLIGRDLNLVETSLADFKQRNKIVDFGQNASLFLSEGSAARKQALELETQLVILKYIEEYMQDKAKESSPIPALAGLGSNAMSSQISEYNKMLMTRDSYLESASAESPVVSELNRQLEVQKDVIIASLKNQTKTLEMELKEARNNEKFIASQVSQVPEKEKESLDIVRKQELYSALYTYLLNKREEVALQLAINEANVRLIEEPMGSGSPISPKTSLILLISLVVGLMIPALVLWLRLVFDITVSGRKDIEKYTTIPMVGEVPHWLGAGDKEVVTKSDGSNDSVTEAFRVLRYGLNFVMHSAKVFVVTSTTPSQGKSFISRNLSAVQGLAN